MASASAVPRRSAVVYFTISSYCWLMRSQLMGRVSIGSRAEYSAASAAAGRYSRCRAIPLSRGDRAQAWPAAYRSYYWEGFEMAGDRFKLKFPRVGRENSMCDNHMHGFAVFWF